MTKLRDIFSLWQWALLTACLALLALSAYFLVHMSQPADSGNVSSFFVVILSIPAIWASHRWLGRRDTILLFAGLGILALAIETFGLLTGFPYGDFVYMDAMGIKLFGITPWAVVLGWSPLVVAAYAIAHRTIESRPLRVVAITFVLIAFDLVIDPGSVKVGLWGYTVNGTYYGVPLSNFAGWAVSGLIAAAAVEAFISLRKPLLPAPVQLTASAVLILFIWTAVALFSAMLWPFVIGCVVLPLLALFYFLYHYAFDEWIVLVDENNVPFRTAKKLEAHDGDTPLHRAFSAFLFNSSFELLLQQRASTKKTWPGVWSNSCCGHPMLHEKTIDAANRRLKHELNIRGVELIPALPDFRYRAEKDGVVENELCPVFVGFYDGPVTLNPNEVDEVRWIAWEQFLEEVNDPANDYSPWAVQEANLLKDIVRLQKPPAGPYYPKSRELVVDAR